MVIVLAKCEMQEVTLKLKDWEYTMPKSDFGLGVVLIDILVVLILIFFAYFLDARQRQYTNLFKDETIEMDDFGVRFENMPQDKEFGGSQIALKAYIWDKLLDVIADQIEEETEEIIQDSEPDYQISDISFARSDLHELTTLMELTKIRTQLIKFDLLAERTKDNSNY